MMQAGGRLWREIREVPLLRYVFAVVESDELTSYRNQIEQAQCSIHTEMSRDRGAMLRESGGQRSQGTAFEFRCPRSGPVEIMLIRFTRLSGMERSGNFSLSCDIKEE